MTIEHASAGSDPGYGILLRSLKRGSKTLDWPMLASINKGRIAMGLNEVLPPAGSKLHRQLQVIAEARALVARIDAERR